MAFAPNGEPLAIGHWDGTVRLWDVRNGEDTILLDYETRGAQYAALNSDGSLLALGSNEAIQLWDTATREVTGTFEGIVGSLTYLRFSDDGSALWFTIRNQSGETRYVWELASNTQTATADAFPPPPDYTGYRDAARTYFPAFPYPTLYAAVPVPASSVVAVVDNASVHFWDAETRLPLFRVRFLTGGAQGEVIGFSADGTVMFTRSSGVVWLWGIA
jgi:WD40 repeat protein